MSCSAAGDSLPMQFPHHAQQSLGPQFRAPRAHSGAPWCRRPPTATSARGPLGALCPPTAGQRSPPARVLKRRARRRALRKMTDADEGATEIRRMISRRRRSHSLMVRSATISAAPRATNTSDASSANSRRVALRLLVGSLRTMKHTVISHQDDRFGALGTLRSPPQRGLIGVSARRQVRAHPLGAARPAEYDCVSAPVHPWLF